MDPNEHLEKFMALHLCFKDKSINLTKTMMALSNYSFFLKGLQNTSASTLL